MNELFYTLSFCAKSLSNVCFQLWHVSVQTSHVRVLHSHTRLVRLVSALPRVSLCCEAWTECLGVQGKEHLFSREVYMMFSRDKLPGKIRLGSMAAATYLQTARTTWLQGYLFCFVCFVFWTRMGLLLGSPACSY